MKIGTDIAWTLPIKTVKGRTQKWAWLKFFEKYFQNFFPKFWPRPFFDVLLYGYVMNYNIGFYKFFSKPSIFGNN